MSTPDTGRAGFRTVLRQLALPVYLPTLAQASGFTAIAPVLPLMALDLGFSIAAAAALGLVSGVLGVLGPVPAGRAITWLGERRAMIITGAALVGVFGLGYWIVHDAATGEPTRGHRLGLIGVLVGIGLTQQVWLLARQSYVGSAVHPGLRARAMSTFGGMMRIGQVIGPALGAAVAAAADLAAVYLMAAVVMVIATVMVTIFLVPRPSVSGSAAGGAGTTDDVKEQPWWRDPQVRQMARVALGTAPLQMARVTRPTILPLVGVTLGLGAETISLIFAVSALIEIVLFIPAGGFMDKFGRTAVIVPCLLMLGVGYVTLAVLATTIGTRSWTMALVTVGGTAVLLALGNGLGAGIVMTLGLDLTPEQDRARHLARWLTMTGAGPLAGPLLVTLVTLFAPVGLAGAAIGALCFGGGAWLLRILPALTPNPPAGPFHRRE